MKKILSVLFVVILLLSSAPLSGFIDTDWSDFKIGLPFGTEASAASSISGKCGVNIYYSFDTNTKELRISGVGEIYSYLYCDSYLEKPWSSVISDIKTVSIDDGVTSIGDGTFANHSSITSITIPNSVTSIGEWAFRGCSSLTSVIIPDSVTSIGYDAFYNTAIYNDSNNWTNNVLYIGNHLIKAKGNISDSYIIKDGTKTIAGSAFRECSSLTSVTIPDSVTSIGDSAFYNTAIYNDSNNWTNNVLYIGNHLIKAKDNISDKYIIKDGTKTIAGGAFEDCSSLTSVTIPDSVTSIGDSAFRDCRSLTSVTIPDSMTSIGDLAFYDCGSLTSVTIPDSVTSIGDFAFDGCHNLTCITIGCSVESLGRYVFYGCHSLTSITIPDSVTSIGDMTFSCCSSLTSVTIPDSVTSIGDSAFENCSRLTSVTIGNSVTSLGKYVFYGCHLVAFSVSENNTYYSSDIYGVLFNKNKTELIQYPSANTKTSYTIPDSVTSIGDNAFYNCSSLTSVAIGKSVTSIGNYAFYDCFRLTSVIIPDSVKIIGEEAFKYCSLTSIVIPDSVTSIGKGAFTDTDIESITIPGSVKSVQNLFSYDYEGYYYYRNTSLKEIIIENGVESISDNAFYNCSSLTSITIPGSVTSIGNGAFYGCNIKDVYYYGTEFTYYYLFGGFYNATVHYMECSEHPEHIIASGKCGKSESDDVIWKLTSTGVLTISGAGNMDDYEWSSDTPWKYKSYYKSIVILPGVTSIGSYAFRDCSSLTSVTIGGSVTSIGDYAFTGCSSLTSITIPNSVTSIGRYGLCFCDNLNDIFYKGTLNSWYKIVTDKALSSDSRLHYNVTSVKSHGKYLKTVAPTCEQKGYDVYQCNCSSGEYWCNYDTPELGHEYDENDICVRCPKMKSGETARTIHIGEQITLRVSSKSERWTSSNSNVISIKKSTTDTYSYIATVLENGTSVLRKYNDSNGSIQETRAYKVVEHIYSNERTVEPTCTEKGYVLHICSCGYSYSSDFTEPLGHDTVINQGKDPTCTTYGWNEYEVCTRCSYTTYQKISAYGHYRVVDEAVSPTCTQPGLSEGAHCANCGMVYVTQKTVSATGHSVVIDYAREATCSKIGLTQGSHCSNCGLIFIKQDIIPIVEHKEVVDDAVSATCTSTGLTEGRKCSVCGTITVAQTEIAATGHTTDTGTVTKAATCTSTGTKTYKCTTCGEVVKTETIAKTGHTEVTLKAVTATASKTGLTEGKKCSVCGKVLVAQKKTIAQVTNLKAVTVAKTSLKLTWTKVAGAKYYKVEQSTDGKTWKTVKTVSTNSLTVSSLKAGAKYQFRVTALDSTKKISGKASAVLKTGTLTSAPTVTLKSSKSKTATASWKKVTGASKYIVYKSTDNKKWTKVTTTTKLTYTLSKLTGGKKIYVKVIAVNAYGNNSAASTVKNVTVKK